MTLHDTDHPAEHPAPLSHLSDLKRFRDAMNRFMLNYQFGMDEVMTKINILKSEFQHLHDYSPIEHVTARLKSPESIYKKIQRKGYPISLDIIRENIRDIAGIRIVCSFINDAYTIADMLTKQPDVTVLDVKDYIKNPKPNGYKSLHVIVEIPVFLSDTVENVHVEVQIRTIAMDFWASLEHKIYYKFDAEIPDHLLDQLLEAANAAGRLDVQMEKVHQEVKSLRPTVAEPGDTDIELPANIALSDLLRN